MTLVLDASAVAELLLRTPRGSAVVAALGDHALIAPQHLTAEFSSVIRGWSLGGHITEAEALQTFRDFEELGVEQLDMVALLPQVHALRHNLTAYDAMYVVLARTVGCSLLTLDQRLIAAAPDCTLPPPK
ncbi:MAG: type II toxin-antitoxin system VapC family toxin [Propionibacteriaceae bacterium]|nr:type II toxin-antitoxin system VapC family toxin [Propionibacteriaceae bacterium]